MVSVVLDKGTKLYRIRKDHGQNFFDKKEWEACPPKLCKQGRFNKKEQSVLYLGTDKNMLAREVGLVVGEKYVIGEYRVLQDIKLGSLLYTEKNQLNIFHLLSKAPCWENLNESEISFLEKYLQDYNITSNKVKDVIFGGKPVTTCGNPIMFPYICNKFIEKELLYNITNLYFEKIIKDFPDGLRYESCFNPFELCFNEMIITLCGENEGNFALTESGSQKIEFVGFEHKEYTYKQKVDSENMLLTFFGKGG